jgi:multidrug resistance efflux pump
LDSKSQALDF